MAGVGISNRQLEHLLRRAGFGARPDELEIYRQATLNQIVDTLVDYESSPDDVDDKIGQAGYAGITTRGQFAPQSNITDSRQRWLFRMVHTNRPLQEKMTLFWHNHFATGYNKIAGTYGATEGARYLAAKASEDPGQVRGQIEMLRDNALGNFRDILLNIARDTAMLVWLDGRTNTKAKPQENFAREIMELFTVGVGNYTEPDVYAGARVFSGWNLQRPGLATDGSQHYEFIYNAAQHDTAAKTFSFPIYADGNRTIPARSAADGLQDGIDLVNALAGNPNTARYLATKLYRFFISDFSAVNPDFVNTIANVYLRSRFDMKTVMREVLLSGWFWDDFAYFSRYSWPVEFVVRALKDVGWTGFSVNDALTPLSNMGQILFEPPDVAGWDAGQAWFSTGAMLARMNFASQIAGNQKFKLATTAKPYAQSPESLVSYFSDALTTAPMDSSVVTEMTAYLRATGAWTGSDAQLQVKAPGLVHLIAGSPEYPARMTITRRQFVKGGVAAFTVTFAAPDFLSDLARAQGAHTRNLIVLNLSGGNDSLSMVVPYNDSNYYSRRPTLAIPAGQVLQIGSDSSKVALGLHPRLTGLKTIFDQGRLALVQRTGYENQSRSHFQGTDIWSTANPANAQGFGWVGRYLDSLAVPVDPLVGWNTTRDLPHVLQAAHTPVPAIASPAGYSFASPNAGAEAAAERAAAVRMMSHIPINRSELAFVYGSSQAALATLDRVATVAQYAGTTTYPNTSFAQALKAVAGAMAKGIGTRVFYVTTGGFDNHSGQGVNATNGAYYGLMASLNDGLTAFYNDLKNQGLLDDTLLVTFSEFGRRISENGSQGTDHGAASVMMVLGGRVNGGLYGTAPVLNSDPKNPTLENNAGDVHYETDFRSVYARVLDNWMGANSVAILGGDFKSSGLAFI